MKKPGIVPWFFVPKNWVKMGGVGLYYPTLRVM